MAYRLSRRTTALRSSAIRDLLRITEASDVISLAGGLPAADSFPVADLRREADRLFGELGPRALQYSATNGVPELRSWIGAEYGDSLQRHIDVDAEILVTHGSQQALDLLGKVLIDRGDDVVMESPVYLGAVQALGLFQPRFEIVEGDDHGMRVDVLAERLARGLRPKLVYVVPNFHNPSGATMSIERRRQLAELVDRYDLLVVEDDPYGSISFDGHAPPAVASFNPRVVHLSTFSKVVAPGFRVGWIIAPAELIEWVVRAKQAADLHTSTFSQLLLAHLADRPGWFDERRDRIVPLYRQRCSALTDALEETFGDEVAFTRPGGGMFLWVAFPRIADTTTLLPRAVERGVAFVPGNAFTIDQRPDSNARLSYATATVDEIGEAVARLRAAADAVSA